MFEFKKLLICFLSNSMGYTTARSWRRGTKGASCFSATQRTLRHLYVFHMGFAYIPALTVIHRAQHIGQGANQAFEDIYHLVLALQQHHPHPPAQVPRPPTTAQLRAALASSEQTRRARTALLVARARGHGDMRVVGDVAKAQRRDDAVRRRWLDEVQRGRSGRTMREGRMSGRGASFSSRIRVQ